MAKKFIILAFILTFLFALLPIVHAHCPLCTTAIGAATISAKYYGLDASIIGLFVGGFGISTGLWLGLKIKKHYFKFQLPVIVVLSFLLTVIPLAYIDTDSIYLPLLLVGPVGSFLNKVYWINKFVLGGISGGLVTLISFFVHIYIKKLNGKALFPFQGIAITLAFLSIFSLGLHFIFGV